MAWTRTGTDSSLNLGLSGSKLIADTTVLARNCCRLYALQDCVIDTIAGDNMDTFAGVTLKAGLEIRGPMTSIKLTSGTAIAYYS